jgi:TolB-like protein/tRNA A-37 threonylcarbamoyl transferase component Bud32
VPDRLSEQLQSTLSGAYSIGRELGGGGMSRVFLATETALGRQVVIKVLPPEMAAGISIERFKREVLLAARLQHPHIVPLLAAGEIDGLPYFTMPFIDGESLRVRLSRGGELPVAEGVRMLREIASALAHAHERGIVHRDIKPDNVLVAGGAAMVSDFGIAKALSASSNDEHSGATSIGVALGTPAYMSPEQATADPSVDHRADVYAFGALAYELLTGQTPFAGRTPQGLLAAHVTELPEPIQRRRPALSPGLAALVMRCLEKRPADRPQSALEIVHALDDLATPSGGMQPTGTSRAVTPAGVSTGRARARTRPSALRMAIALGILAAIGTALFTWRRMGANATNESPDRSIAVLAFTNAGGDSSQSYFAEGLADELTTSLGRLPGLRVASRSAAFAFEKRKVTAQDAGRALHVSAVLEGAVRRAGGRLRISTQLTNVADGLALWSDSFERDTGDVFTAQDELGRRITAALHEKLALAQSPRTTGTARGTADPAAYDAYLRGRFLLARRCITSLQQADKVFSEAIARDSNFARAWAGRAMVRVVLRDFIPNTDDSTRAGIADAKRAFTLDPNLADADIALGYGQSSQWEWKQAEEGFRRAIALEPANADAHHWYADLLQGEGRMPEALAEMREALRLDPASAIVSSELSYIYYIMRRYDESIAQGHRAMELDSTFFTVYTNFALSYSYKGHPDSTLLLLARGMRVASDTSGPGIKPLIATALTVSGRRTEGERVAAEVEDEAARHVGSAFDAALTRAGLGDREGSMRWLTESVNRHEADIASKQVGCDPLLDILKSDARFQALLDRVGVSACPAQKLLVPAIASTSPRTRSP